MQRPVCSSNLEPLDQPSFPSAQPKPNSHISWPVHCAQPFPAVMHPRTAFLISETAALSLSCQLCLKLPSLFSDGVLAFSGDTTRLTSAFWSPSLTCDSHGCPISIYLGIQMTNGTYGTCPQCERRANLSRHDIVSSALLMILAVSVFWMPYGVDAKSHRSNLEVRPA